MIRKTYSMVVPVTIRKLIWAWRNIWVHAFSEKLPAGWKLDYVSYWHQRLIERGDNISYPEIIQIVASLIPFEVRMLDIGCGAGEFLIEVGKQRKIAGIGIDVSSVAVEIAQRKGVDAHVCDASKDSLARFGDFDIVSCFEVLEHIPNAEEILINVRDAFPHADLIVSIPNTGYIASRFRLLMGRFPKQWHIHPAEHLRFWTLQDFRFMAHGIGYEILNVYPIRGFICLSKWWPGLFAEALVFHMRTRRELG